MHPTFNLHTTRLRLNTKMGWRFKVSPPYSLPSNGIVILATPTDTVVLTREVRYACNIQKLSSESHWHLATAMPQSTGECPWVIAQLIRIPPPSAREFHQFYGGTRRNPDSFPSYCQAAVLLLTVKLQGALELSVTWLAGPFELTTNCTNSVFGSIQQN